MDYVIKSGISTEWNNANKFNDTLVKTALKRYGANAKDKEYQKYFNNNEAALKAFINRRDKGLNLSGRVWNLSKEYKNELEVAISAGIEKGMSAVTLSKRISKYLKDYKSLQADYGEKFGRARKILDCEYRSARLVRTEVNMAYRTADNVRWNQLDFVVGYEIKRSGSFFDCSVCESLTGKYPKDFLFTGWHPNCRCYMVSILNTDEEFWNDSETSVNEVTDVPDNFKAWIAANADRIQEAEQRGTLPYFMRDNPDYITITERSFSAISVKDIVNSFGETVKDDDILNVLNHFVSENDIKLNGDLVSVNTVKSSSDTAIMFLDREYRLGAGDYIKERGQSLTFVDRKYRDLNYNAYHEFKTALNSIKVGDVLTRQQEYSVENVWHELRHAQAKGWKNIANSDKRSNKNANSIISIMETLNQHCARRTYDGFLNSLGGTSTHKDWILKSGYGYSQEVSNFNAMLDYFKIDKAKAYKSFDDIFMNSYYEDIPNKLSEFISAEAGISKSGVNKLLNIIDYVDFQFAKKLKTSK